MKELGRYDVIYKERTENNNVSYVCRKPGEKDTYLAVVMPRGDLLGEIIPYAARNRIEDFVEDFSLPDGYCMVFKYTAGDTLKKAAHGGKNPAELIHSLLVTLISKNLTKEYTIGILTHDRIIVDRFRRIQFVYAPPRAAVEVTDDELWRKTAELLEGLWPQPPDEQGRLWLDTLRDGGFLNLCEAYSKMPEPAAAPHTPERRISKLAPIIERIPALAAAALALVAAAAAALLYFSAQDAETEPGRITQIGDVIIAED